MDCNRRHRPPYLMNCAWWKSYHWPRVTCSAYTRALFHYLTSKMAVNDAFCHPSLTYKRGLKEDHVNISFKLSWFVKEPLVDNSTFRSVCSDRLFIAHEHLMNSVWVLPLLFYLYRTLAKTHDCKDLYVTLFWRCTARTTRSRLCSHSLTC